MPANQRRLIIVNAFTTVRFGSIVLKKTKMPRQQNSRKSELIADFVCRLLSHMAGRGAKRVEVVLRAQDHNMPLGPWIDPENFNANYIMRGQHLLPKSGDKPEWRHTQDYWREKDDIPAIDLDDEVFRYA